MSAKNPMKSNALTEELAVAVIDLIPTTRDNLYLQDEKQCDII